MDRRSLLFNLEKAPSRSSTSLIDSTPSVNHLRGSTESNQFNQPAKTIQLLQWWKPKNQEKHRARDVTGPISSCAHPYLSASMSLSQLDSDNSEIDLNTPQFSLKSPRQQFESMTSSHHQARGVTSSSGFKSGRSNQDKADDMYDLSSNVFFQSTGRYLAHSLQMRSIQEEINGIKQIVNRLAKAVDSEAPIRADDSAQSNTPQVNRQLTTVDQRLTCMERANDIEIGKIKAELQRVNQWLTDMELQQNQVTNSRREVHNSKSILADHIPHEHEFKPIHDDDDNNDDDSENSYFAQESQNEHDSVPALQSAEANGWLEQNEKDASHHAAQSVNGVESKHSSPNNASSDQPPLTRDQSLFDQALGIKRPTSADQSQSAAISSGNQQTREAQPRRPTMNGNGTLQDKTRLLTSSQSNGCEKRPATISSEQRKSTSIQHSADSDHSSPTVTHSHSRQVATQSQPNRKRKRSRVSFSQSYVSSQSEDDSGSTSEYEDSGREKNSSNSSSDDDDDDSDDEDWSSRKKKKKQISTPSRKQSGKANRSAQAAPDTAFSMSQPVYSMPTSAAGSPLSTNGSSKLRDVDPPVLIVSQPDTDVTSPVESKSSPVKNTMANSNRSKSNTNASSKKSQPAAKSRSRSFTVRKRVKPDPISFTQSNELEFYYPIIGNPDGTSRMLRPRQVKQPDWYRKINDPMAHLFNDKRVKKNAQTFSFSQM